MVSTDNVRWGSINRSLLLPHPFPLLCGVSVSCETPPLNSVLRFLPRQFSLRQVVPDVIQPSLIRSSSPSFPGTSIPITLWSTYSSSSLNTCPYNFNLHSCTFLDVSPTFAVFLMLSFLILSSLFPLICLYNVSSSHLLPQVVCILRLQLLQTSVNLPLAYIVKLNYCILQWWFT